MADKLPPINFTALAEALQARGCDLLSGMNPVRLARGMSISAIPRFTRAVPSWGVLSAGLDTVDLTELGAGS